MNQIHLSRTLGAILLSLATLFSFTNCSSSSEQEVQKLIPDNTVIAHRGTIYWAPELTEAAFRWARNSAADYLELDVHRTIDGHLVVMHDKTLKRTTNVGDIFPGRENDPIGTFTLGEILQLSAGVAFNQKNAGQARASYEKEGVLIFEDVFRIAEGKRIKRNRDGSRLFSITDTGEYLFEYEDDPAENGHRPGIYIETKATQSYPDLEKQIYESLTAFGWNPLEASGQTNISRDLYQDGKVNIGNTRGKVLVQTFSREGMLLFRDYFRAEIPTSFLVKSPAPDDPDYVTKIDEIIAFALESGAQFIGTNLSLQAGEVSNRLFLDKIREAGLKINIYSFNTTDQMDAYFNKDGKESITPLLNGMITNRTDLTTHFYKEKDQRPIEPSQDPVKILDELGY
ncbi:MAG: glycerophosphodiester phosphodiesterase family protein [Proteiniphilum sp.]